MQGLRPSKAFGLCGTAFIVVALAGVWATSASAVSLRVKLACSKDYYTHCRQFASDSPEVRRCMRSAGERLSPRCLSALIAAGEVSETEVAARRAAQSRQ
jgi:hypothetical protein